MSNFPAKILAATDGSEDAALAVRAAADLSGTAGSELHLVHAMYGAAFLGRSLADASQSSRTTKREEAESLLEEQAEQARVAGETKPRTHLREGRPAEEIAELAEELGVGLVVIGSRGLGPIKRLVTGSVSEGVVHLSSCPILIVRGGETAWPPSRLVVGDDGSEASQRAGELAASMGRFFRARTLLVRVYPSVAVFKSGRVVHVRSSGEILKKGERSLKKRAAELGSVLGTRPETKVASGDAAAIIQEAAEESGEPTLVAVGRRGTGLARYSTLGSVAPDLFRSGVGPVLIAPPPERHAR